MTMVEFRWGAATDVGRVRTNNEDSLITSDHLFAVADGMGGHQGGEVASDLALQTLQATFTEQTTAGLHTGARDPNAPISGRAAGAPQPSGMGPTPAALAPRNGAEEAPCGTACE